MRFFLLIGFLVLTGCSNLPPAIEDPPAYDLSYVEAASNINKFKNAPLRWGGTIIEVENEPNFSAIQILVYPLGSYGRPDLDEPSQGRFVVTSPEFLDPAVYSKNSSITVAGILNGDTERKVGNKPLRLPLVAAKNIHIWPEQTYNSYYYGGYGGFGYYPYGGFYSPYPYYWGGYYWPYHRRWR